MLYTFGFPIVLVMFAFVFITLKLEKEKKSTFKANLFFVSLFFIIIEANVNYTNLFVSELNHPIILDENIKTILRDHNIPEPKFKKHRFFSNRQLSIYGDKVILPIDYVAFDKAQINYILLSYIDNNTLTNKRYKELQQRQAEMEEARKKGLKIKKQLVSHEDSMKLKRINNEERIANILKNKGELNCSFSLKKIGRECIFIPQEELNLDKNAFYDSEEFRLNLLYNYDKVLAKTLNDKKFYIRHDKHSYLELPKEIF